MKLGLLTIGQSPRSDIAPTFLNILDDDIELIQRGALDSLTEEELEEVKPKGETVTYISKLRTNQSIKISKERLIPLLQSELNELEKQVDMVVMLCTGDFPMLKYDKPIIYPDKVLVNMIDALNFKKHLGLLIPLTEQKETITEKWKRININKSVQVCSPYDDVEQLDLEKINFNKSEISMIVLDCMGYSEKHKNQLREHYGLPVVLARELVANYVKSLF